MGQANSFQVNTGYVRPPEPLVETDAGPERTMVVKEEAEAEEELGKGAEDELAEIGSKGGVPGAEPEATAKDDAAMKTTEKRVNQMGAGKLRRSTHCMVVVSPWRQLAEAYPHCPQRKNPLPPLRWKRRPSRTRWSLALPSRRVPPHPMMLRPRTRSRWTLTSWKRAMLPGKSTRYGRLRTMVCWCARVAGSPATGSRKRDRIWR